MAISASQKLLLNDYMGAVAKEVQLGTLIETAETVDPADGSISVEHLDSGILPSHVVKHAGKHTTAGGDATEVITVTGLVTSDIVHVTVQTAGGTPRSIVASVLTANTITVTMSGDPSTDHILAYSVLRAVA